MAFIKSVSCNLSNHEVGHNTDPSRHNLFILHNETVTPVPPSTQTVPTSPSCCVDSRVHLCEGSAQCLEHSKLSGYTTLTVFIKGANPFIEEDQLTLHENHRKKINLQMSNFCECTRRPLYPKSVYTLNFNCFKYYKPSLRLYPICMLY